jgi:methylated-DNA-[protein]-cysteine S-methyltransferase
VLPSPFHETVHSPVGSLTLYADTAGLTRISFEEQTGMNHPNEWTQKASKALFAYFDGQIPTEWPRFTLNGSPFQLKIWHALAGIHPGSTETYASFTDKIGDPAQIRAVAGALARNPIPILIPCHRVIGSDGSLTGYIGGLAVKKWLLLHEKAIPGAQVQLFD